MCKYVLYDRISCIFVLYIWKLLTNMKNLCDIDKFESMFMFYKNYRIFKDNFNLKFLGKHNQLNEMQCFISYFNTTIQTMDLNIRKKI